MKEVPRIGAGELHCYLRGKSTIDIEPSPPRREWMDRSRGAMAYRCLPLVAANTHGWEIRCPSGFELEWNGGDLPSDLQVFADAASPGDGGESPPSIVKSHFGSGIVTFVPDLIVRSAPGDNLWVSGSPNYFKDGIQALSALIETDWMPYTFTMNWRVTRPHCRIRFEAGEPYCFFFPVRRHLAEEVEPTIRRLEDDPELASAYRELYESRRAAPSSSERDEPTRRQQAWYLQGKLPDNPEEIAEHQRRIRVKSFRRC